MIDDTLFLKAAEQIRHDPMRPFTFLVNWYGWEEPFWRVFKNPPGLAYWLAAVSRLLGESELVLHAAMLPFAAAAVGAGVWLARRFAANSPWLTAAWVASPAFLVSSATLMADVPSLAFVLWALVFWIRGADSASPGSRRLGALLAGVAFIVKYTAGLGVVTLVLYAILVVQGDERRRALGDLWPAVLAPAAWSLLTLATHERNHILDALAVGGGGLDPNPGWFFHRGIALMTFVAAAGVVPVVQALATLRARGAVMVAGAAVLIGLAAAIATPWVWSPRGLPDGAVLVVGILVAAGALAMIVAFREGIASVDRDGWFLAAWLGIQVLYLWLWSWTIAARFVLPMLPPLALLLARALGARPASVGEPQPPVSGRSHASVLAVSALVALAVSVPVLLADGYAGEFYRRALPQIAAQARSEGRAGYFVGAWGFQHYAERAGLTKLNVDAPRLPAGAILLQPYYAANRDVPREVADRLERLASLPGPPPPLRIHTMNINVGAGFYSSVYGPLPFYFAHLPAEGVIVWRVRQ